MRVIAFGCSYTYGHGLPDCIDKNNHKAPGPNPSIFSWANLFATKHMRRPCVNMSNCGASNQRIAWNILNFDFRENDYVIIMWTHPFRNGMINQDKTVTEFKWYNLNEKRSKLYYQHIDNDVNSLYNYASSINLVEKYLKTKQIQFLNLEHVDSKNLYKEHDLINLHNTLEFHNYGLYFSAPPIRFQDVAVDKRHPGRKAHHWYASQLAEKTKVKFNLENIFKK